jgi:plastocyanin
MTLLGELRPLVRRIGRSAALAVLVGCTAGCGSSIYTSSPGPATPLLDDEWPRSPTPDVSVTAGGFQPQVLHVDAPVTVIFTNNDTVSHTLQNAPGLGWDNCPEMNTPVALAPGQVARVPFQEADAVCTYEDAAQPDNKAFQGYIAIHRSS